MFLLVPAHPGFPGQIPQSRKTVVCVCVLAGCWRFGHYGIYVGSLLAILAGCAVHNNDPQNDKFWQNFKHDDILFCSALMADYRNIYVYLVL